MCIRDRFPAFAEPSLAGWAFFENAGGSYACRQVIDRLGRFYRERKVQPYAPYAASQAGGAEMDEARARLAALLGVETDEMMFGPSTSQNIISSVSTPSSAASRARASSISAPPARLAA